jgi:thioredoxin 2
MATMTESTTTSAPSAPKLTVPCSNCGKWNRILASRVADRPKCGVCGTPIALDHPLHLNDDTFDRVVSGSDLPVLVDFYADWCGPCKMMAPFVDELARTEMGKVLIAKLDTDHAPRTAQRFNIRGIPTTIVFRGGKEVKRQSGAMPLPALKAMLV